MTHLSLFSGIGGLDLAAEWAGFETVGQCEWADYPTKVLEKHCPDVPRWRDIRTLTAEDFYARTRKRTVDVISGGFPCQPFSMAGKQKGKGDDRYLWPEMLRVIRELKPRWVLGENVPGILRIAASDVVTDLEREGFDVVVFDFEAAAVGAVHRRERVAFVANRKSGTLENPGCDGWLQQGVLPEQPWGGELERRSEIAADADSNPCESWWAEPAGQQRASGLANGSYDVAPTNNRQRIGTQGEICTGRSTTDCCGTPVSDTQSAELSGKRRTTWERRAELGCGRWWSVEPDVGRVANGVPNRVDRIKCLGNAVVPQQFYPIFKAIAEVEAYER